MVVPIEQLAVERCMANWIVPIRDGHELVMEEYDSANRLSTTWMVERDFAEIDHGKDPSRI